MAKRSQEPISSVLVRLLDDRRMTQADLCRAAELDRATVSRYLSGGRGTLIDGRGARTIEKLAGALGVAPDFFLEYRAWRIRQIAAVSPDLVDDFYDLAVEVARLRGLIKDGPDDAKQ